MNEARDFRRILLIRRKALGDAVVTIPAVQEVLRKWPYAKVDLVIDRPFADLVAHLVPGVNVLAWPPPRGKSWWGILRRGNYDLTIDWLGNPRTAMWTMATGAEVRVGYDLPRRRWAYNVKVPRNREGDRSLRGFAGEAFMDPLRALGVQPSAWRDGFAADSQRRALRDLPLRPQISTWLQDWKACPGTPAVVVMSATWPAKMWPADRIVDLLRRLPQSGVNPVLVPGPGDEWLTSAVDDAGVDIRMAPPTSLLELAQIVCHSDLFVGTDCGPRHLAAAFGVPTVTVFGPTDPRSWNPPSVKHVAVTVPVDCAPCDLTVCPVDGHPCLNGLDSGTVIASVESVLAGSSEGASVENER